MEIFKNKLYITTYMAKIYMGSDAKLVERGSYKLFRANLGVVIKTEQLENFNKLYDRFFDQSFKELKFRREKIVFKSSELRALFGDQEEEWIKFLLRFAEVFSQCEFIEVNVVHSVFDMKKLREVKYYGTDRTPTTTQPPEQLINTLGGYFSYLAPWKICKCCKLFDIDIYVDDFSGHETNSWNELRAHNRILGLPNGDRCNRLISTSDIMCRFIDTILYRRKERFETRAIEKLLEVLKLDNFHSFYIGHHDIKEIVPINKKNVFLSQIYKRPTIFVLKENIIPKEREFIYANQSMMNKLSDHATLNDSGFKVIDYSFDARLVSDGDILIYYGANGMKQAQLLKNMGLKVSVTDLSKL